MPSAEEMGRIQAAATDELGVAESAAETIELVPYGCSQRFRVSMFPYV
jgi:hypothetical protein